jgi:hypothetical protein
MSVAEVEFPLSELARLSPCGAIPSVPEIWISASAHLSAPIAGEKPEKRRRKMPDRTATRPCSK